MSYDYARLKELLAQLKDSKTVLIHALKDKGEEVSEDASFADLVDQASDGDDEDIDVAVTEDISEDFAAYADDGSENLDAVVIEDTAISESEAVMTYAVARSILSTDTIELSYNRERLKELLAQLKDSKANLIDTLRDKGEDVSDDASFVDLIQQAGDYLPKSYILIDADGNEIPGALVNEETLFTAEETDVREGKVFVTETGVKTGTKIIPSYNTTEGFFMVSPGNDMKIPIPDKRELYDYTKFQAIICPFNTSLGDSVCAEKVSMGDKMYNVQSANVLSTVSKDVNAKSIYLGIANESDKIAIIYYFTYKEIY